MTKKPRHFHGDTITRHPSLPTGFKPHKGGRCPVEPDTYVETMIRTAQGIGSGGITKANLHEWSARKHPGGLGKVVGYRIVDRAAETGADPLLGPTV